MPDIVHGDENLAEAERERKCSCPMAMIARSYGIGGCAFGSGLRILIMAIDPLTTALHDFALHLVREEPLVASEYDAMVAHLRAAGAGRGAPQPGSRIPSFTLPDETGSLVSSEALLEHGPVVLSFIRGSWCEFCSIELEYLRRHATEIEEMGGQIVVISAELAGGGAALRAERKLPFPILADADFGVAMIFGLVVPVNEAVRDLHRSWGLNFARLYGADTPFLPIPATYVVAGDHQVVAAHVDPDFRRRMPIEAILDALAQKH